MKKQGATPSSPSIQPAAWLDLALATLRNDSQADRQEAQAPGIHPPCLRVPATP